MEPFKITGSASGASVPGPANNNAGWGTFVIHRLELPKEKTRALMERTVAYLEAQKISGAGFAADKALREFQLEYTSRAIQHGASSMPSSFEVGCSFFESSKQVYALTLLPEVDHLVSFTDFLDYVTGGDSPTADVGKAYELKDSVIYNVTSLDRPDDLLIQTDTSSSFGFLAASMVRRADELSVMLTLGEQPSEEDRKERALAARLPPELNPGKGFLGGIDTSNDVPIMLDDSELTRVIALVRFNLKERRMEVRMLLRDYTNKYAVKSDSVLVLPPENSEYTEHIASVVKELDDVGSVWEIAKTICLLPAYLAKRIDCIQTEKRETELKARSKLSMKLRKTLEKAPIESKVQFRTISAVRVMKTEAAAVAGRSWSAPSFQVPVVGFWRYFKDADRKGHDEEGAEIVGKTWVKAHIRWGNKEAPEEPKVVYIKASLSLARQRLLGFQAKKAAGGLAGKERQPGDVVPATQDQLARMPEEQPQVCEPGDVDAVASYLYVMRCPAHGKDIFKVGYTDRDPEVRAQELSAATAAPTHFLVVQAWAVTDGAAAERAAHEQLATLRLSDRREFFKGTYKTLRSEIEAVIAPWEIS